MTRAFLLDPLALQSKAAEALEHCADRVGSQTDLRHAAGNIVHRGSSAPNPRVTDPRQQGATGDSLREARVAGGQRLEQKVPCRTAQGVERLQGHLGEMTSHVAIGKPQPIAVRDDAARGVFGDYLLAIPLARRRHDNVASSALANSDASRATRARAA